MFRYAILMAAKFGISVNGATCYATLRPCFGCSKELIRGGVQTVHYIHDWSHLDSDCYQQYLALQAGFPGGVHGHGIEAPKVDWAVRSRHHA